MQINASSLIHHPLERVYRAYKDELVQIAAFMPNIKEILVLSREEVPGGAKLHNEWAGKGEIPKVVRGILKPEMVRWDDYAAWDDTNHLCHWEIKTRAFTDNVTCRGINRMTAEGEGATRVTLQGNLDVHLQGIPGVPGFLAKGIAPQVEKFIIALITPNLEQVNQALERYLDAHP
jgi:hypothetical protein